MKIAKRANQRRLLRAGVLGAGLLVSLLQSVPAAAQSPEQPTRLPPVGQTDRQTQADTNNPAPSNDVTQAASSQVPLISGDEARARVAALKTATVPHPQPNKTASRRWLRTTTADARLELARRLLAEGSRNYDVRAWLSAEANAWEAMQLAAEATDIARRALGVKVSPEETDIAMLHVARKAITEARDFARWSNPADPQAVARIARSHATKILHSEMTEGMTATDASDRYLDTARVNLARLAAASVEAAQAMDLLAATLLTRNEVKQLPASTALCLRRAAFQGQPNNADLAYRLGSQLAKTGLYREAEWALQHSLSVQPNPATAAALATVLRRSGQTAEAEQVLMAYRYPAPPATSVNAPRIPQITQLSPDQFATISPSLLPNQTSPNGETARIANLPVETQTTQEDNPGVIRSFFGSFRSVW